MSLIQFTRTHTDPDTGERFPGGALAPITDTAQKARILAVAPRVAYDTDAAFFDPASPGTIGGDTPAAATFTTLSAALMLATANGSASAPVYSRAGDTDTGLFFGAANQVDIATGGVTRLQVRSGGAVMIGSTGSAIAQLHVVASGTPALYLERAADARMVEMQGSGYLGFIDINATGVVLGNNSGSRAIILNTNSTNRLEVRGDGQIVITSPSLGPTGLDTNAIWCDEDNGNVLKMVRP